MHINDFVILPHMHNAVGKIKDFLEDDNVLVTVDGNNYTIPIKDLGRIVKYYQ